MAINRMMNDNLQETGTDNMLPLSNLINRIKTNAQLIQQANNRTGEARANQEAAVTDH